MDQTQASAFTPWATVHAVYCTLPIIPSPTPYPYPIPIQYTMGAPLGGPAASPLMMLAQAAGQASRNAFVPLQQTVEPSHPSNERQDLFMLGCLGDFVLEALGWYRCGVVPTDDVTQLAQRVARYMYSICDYYTKHRNLPPKDMVVELVGSPLPFDTMQSTSEFAFNHGNNSSVESLAAMPINPLDDFADVPYHFSPFPSPSSYAGESTASPSISGEDTESLDELSPLPCTCDGLPSRHEGMAVEPN